MAHIHIFTLKCTHHLKRYAQGEHSFMSLDLENTEDDFSGTTLLGANFSGCFITASVRDANPELAIFKNVSVKTCDFTDANLREACLEDSPIDGAVFAGVNLLGASLLGTSEYGHG